LFSVSPVPHVRNPVSYTHLLKATKVEGIYDADPVITRDAVKFEQITYMEILRLGLKVMDTTAVSLCKDNNLPMIIFNLNQPGNCLLYTSRCV